MIYYDSGGFHIFLKLFKCEGSNFPKTVLVALPSAIIAAILQASFPNASLRLQVFGEDTGGIMSDAQAWSGFSFLVGFLIVFRTSQAYGRFWEGCTASHTMRAEWFDACSSLVSFCKASCAPPQEVAHFKSLLIRLTSMLHAAALAELESGDRNSSSRAFARDYSLIDPGAVDYKSIETLKTSQARVELIFEWIQQLIVENIESGVLSIPAPILSRSFQELANGMVAFHDAMKISFIPFPFPYAQSCDFLLVFHWVLVPIVTSQWVSSMLWAAVFTFTQVFILWSLNLIAIEIDNPFGRDKNDIDANRMQDEINMHLSMLVAPSTERTPRLWRTSTYWTNGSMTSSHYMRNSYSQLLNSTGSFAYDNEDQLPQSPIGMTVPSSSRGLANVAAGDVEYEAVEALAANMQRAIRSSDNPVNPEMVVKQEVDHGSTFWGHDSSGMEVPSHWGSDSSRRGSYDDRGDMRSDPSEPSIEKVKRPRPPTNHRAKQVHQCLVCSTAMPCGRSPAVEVVGDTNCAQCFTPTCAAEHTCPNCYRSFCRTCMRESGGESDWTGGATSAFARTPFAKRRRDFPVVCRGQVPCPPQTETGALIRTSSLEDAMAPTPSMLSEAAPMDKGVSGQQRFSHNPGAVVDQERRGSRPAPGPVVGDMGFTEAV